MPKFLSAFALKLMAVFGWSNAHFAPEDLRKVARARIPNLQPDIDHAFGRFPEEPSGVGHAQTNEIL
jgi:hypothetical protein